MALKEHKHTSKILSKTRIGTYSLRRDFALIQYLTPRFRCCSLLIQTTTSALTGSIISLVQCLPLFRPIKKITKYITTAQPRDVKYYVEGKLWWIMFSPKQGHQRQNTEPWGPEEELSFRVWGIYFERIFLCLWFPRSVCFLHASSPSPH